MPLAVLGLPKRSRDVGGSLAPAVNAIPGEVELVSDDTSRPLRSTVKIHHTVPGPREFEAHVLDRRRPEPLRLLRRPALKLAKVGGADPLNQADDIRLLEHLRRRSPGDLHPARKPRERACRSS